MSDLHLTVHYDVEKDDFIVESDIKPGHRADVIADFIHSQVGAGADPSPAEDHKRYTIRLRLDLSDDTFYVSHNCGNKGLRDGILMRVMSRL